MNRARAQGSQPPSPVGVVGWRKQLALLLLIYPPAVGTAMQLQIDWRTEKHVLRAPNYSIVFTHRPPRAGGDSHGDSYKRLLTIRLVEAPTRDGGV